MSEIKFILQKINTDEFATIEIEPIDSNKFQLQLNFEIGFSIDKKNKALQCFLKFQYQFEKKPFIILKINCEFQIEENAWKEFSNEKTTKITFPKGFLQHLAVITIGTARGVLHSKTEGTEFNKYYLPTINVHEVVTTDKEFPLD